MAAIGGRAAHVVDRARRVGDRSGKLSASSSGAVTSRTVGAADPNAARSSPRSRSTCRASEQTEITIAFRGPTFMKVCADPLGVDATETTISSGSSAFCLTPTQEVAKREAPLTPDARDLHLGVLDEQRRQRVTGGRGRAEVAADRAAVADLR